MGSLNENYFWDDTWFFEATEDKMDIPTTPDQIDSLASASSHFKVVQRWTQKGWSIEDKHGNVKDRFQKESWNAYCKLHEKLKRVLSRRPNITLRQILLYV